MQRLLELKDIPTIIREQLEIVSKVNNRFEVPGVLLDVQIRGLAQRIRQHINYLLLQEFKSLCNLEDPMTAEIMRSVLSPESGLYLNADPVDSALQIRDEQFILHTKRRLLLNITSYTET